MDPRQILDRAAKETGISLAAASKAIGRSAAYLHQYINYGWPRELRESDRENLELIYKLQPGTLKEKNKLPKNGQSSIILPNNQTDDKQDKRVSVKGTASGIDLSHLIVKQESFLTGRRDLPVFSSAAAGEGFVISTNEPIDWGDRPAYLAGVTGAFGFILYDESLYPRYERGEILIVHPRPPLRGKDALIFISNGEHEMVALILPSTMRTLSNSTGAVGAWRFSRASISKGW
jgi:hypothetical protein